MIAGATRGNGGPEIAAYLMDQGDNDLVVPGPCRGLLATGLPGQVAELRARAARGRSAQPILHAHANPPPDQSAWSEADWSTYWAVYEEEFELQAQPWTEVTHVKAGRMHRHRLYLLVRPDGTCISLSHGKARHEYLSRLTEHRMSVPMIAGRHNRAVAARLVRDGHEDAAEAMRTLGLLDCPRPAGRRFREQRQAERTGVTITDVEQAVLAAWQGSDTVPAFKAALWDRGLTLERGTSVSKPGDPVVILRDWAGGAHGLRMVLDRVLRQSGQPGASLASMADKLGGARQSHAALYQLATADAEQPTIPTEHRAPVDGEDAVDDRSTDGDTGRGGTDRPPEPERAGLGRVADSRRRESTVGAAGTRGGGPDRRPDRSAGSRGGALGEAGMPSNTAGARRGGQGRVVEWGLGNALSGHEHARRLDLQPGPRADDVPTASDEEVAYMADMPSAGWADQSARKEWLMEARLGRYDMRRLPEALGETLTGMTVVPERETVVLDLADGGRVFDTFRRLIFCGPAGLLSAGDWRATMSQRGWAVTIFENADEISARLSAPIDPDVPTSWPGGL